jgi:acyl-CoA thioester hydrolase
MMGIVHHASYLTYFEVGRVEFMRRRGVCYADWIGRGIYLPIAEVGLRYRRPARFDQELSVDTWIDTLSPYSVRFAYTIHSVEDGGAESEPPKTALIVSGHTCQACIDEQRRLIPIPDEIAGLLAEPEASG